MCVFANVPLSHLNSDLLLHLQTLLLTHQLGVKTLQEVLSLITSLPNIYTHAHTKTQPHPSLTVELEKVSQTCRKGKQIDRRLAEGLGFPSHKASEREAQVEGLTRSLLSL